MKIHHTSHFPWLQLVHVCCKSAVSPREKNKRIPVEYLTLEGWTGDKRSIEWDHYSKIENLIPEFLNYICRIQSLF